MLSTHHIDEVSDLIEHVLLIDHGRILFDEDAETLRAHATVVSGSVQALADFTAGKTVLHRETLGSLARAAVVGLSADDRTDAKAAGLDLSGVGLQELMVLSTSAHAEEGSR
jgi:ABC-2 type transport system ATP-binding protein